MKKLLVSMLLSCLSFGVLAQPGGDDEGGPGGPPRWGLGIGALVKNGYYAGESSDVMPIPLLSYHGERFQFSGITASWRFIDNESFELSALAKPRLDGFDVKDLGRDELARNGIDYQLLDDRDIGVDVGVGMKWRGRAGEIDIEAVADVVDASGGQELSIQYGYPFDVGRGRLTPTVGVTWQSKDMANYYYGTLDTEVAGGVIDYKPGAVTKPFAGLQYFRPLGQKWSVMAFAKYDRLPDEIQDSPLMERDTKGTVTTFIGFSRGF